MDKTIKAKKAPKAPKVKEIRRNIPAIDISFTIGTVIFSILFCAVMTYICTWGYYTTIVEAETYTFASMIEYLTSPKNTPFTTSYIFGGLVLWGTIGFVLSKVIIKAIKYFINYK